MCVAYILAPGFASSYTTVAIEHPRKPGLYGGVKLDERLTFRFERSCSVNIL